MKHQEKIREFNRVPKAELEVMLKEKKQDLMQFKFDLQAGKVKNVREIRETRRDIARLKTIINNKPVQEVKKENA